MISHGIEEGTVDIGKMHVSMISMTVDHDYYDLDVYNSSRVTMNFLCDSNSVLTFIGKDGRVIKLVCKSVKVEAKPVFEEQTVRFFTTEKENGSDGSEVQSSRERDAAGIRNCLF